MASPLKAPWYVDLLNLNLENTDLATAKARMTGVGELLDEGKEKIGLVGELLGEFEPAELAVVESALGEQVAELLMLFVGGRHGQHYSGRR